MRNASMKKAPSIEEAFVDQEVALLLQSDSNSNPTVNQNGHLKFWSSLRKKYCIKNRIHQELSSAAC